MINVTYFHELDAKTNQRNGAFEVVNKYNENSSLIHSLSTEYINILCLLTSSMRGKTNVIF